VLKIFRAAFPRIYEDIFQNHRIFQSYFFNSISLPCDSFRKYVQAIESYNGDDPLELWLRCVGFCTLTEDLLALFSLCSSITPNVLFVHSYIKWSQETFHSGGHKAEIVPLLERCTRELQKHEKYRNDIRYLRVWIQYVSFLADHNKSGKCSQS
jgi:hypothetical protein